MSVLESLSFLEERFRKGGGRNNIELQVEILKLVRENNISRPRLVLSCGIMFVFRKENNHSKAVKSVSQIELYEIYHQVFLSALLLHDILTAECCFGKVLKKFGEKSIRVRIMQGLLCEAQSKLVSAKNTYKDILDDDNSNLIAIKRLAAIQKSRGYIKEAVDTLTRMVDQVFLNDQECYMELADLYIELNDFTSAMYCLEECLMKDPKNYFLYLRCGDVCYTSGEYILARKYYSKSLELNKGCMRANMGLILTLKSCKGNKTTNELKKELDKNIFRHYLEKNADDVIVESLKALVRD